MTAAVLDLLPYAAGALAAVYLAAGARWIYRWARRNGFDVRGDPPVALAMLLILWLTWPALWDAEREAERDY